MDVQTPLICAGVVAVTSAVVYLSSVFGIRERTYEEAIEEQRKRNELDLSMKSNKTDKPKKEKKERKREKTNKKDKSKDRTNNGNNGVHPQTHEHKSQTKENSHKESVSQSGATRKTELVVGFRTEPEILNEEPEGLDASASRKSSVSSIDKPIKPILTNKNEQTFEQMDVFGHSMNGRAAQRNSFDQSLPKDEFELLKDSKRALEREALEPVVEQLIDRTAEDNELQAPHPVSSAADSSEANSSQPQSSEPEFKHEILKTETTDNSSPARKSRKWKQSQLEGSAKEVSAKTIIELVKTVTLNNEEIQLLTDILLNKQSDGSTEWRKKNDPTAVLKKQLQEKETALEKVTKNLEAAVQKTRELRNELENEKSRQLNSREKSTQMQIEIQALHMKLQQNYESHRSESNAMQKQLQQIQVKCNEERTHVLRLQEDNSRLQQLVKNEQHLKHEIDQLRNDRQQFELRMAATQKTNEELIRKTQQLENRIKSMSDSRQKDETTYQMHVKDVQQELQKCETQRNALAEELGHSSNKCNSLESESIQLRNRYKDLEESKNEELKRLSDQLSEVNEEKTILENALTEAKHQTEQQSGEQTTDRQELQKLNEELIATKEELKNLKNALESQLRNNEELKDINRKSNESIENFEKVKNECINNALKVSEEATNEFRTECETLRNQNKSLNTRLTEATDANDSSIKELESVKSELLLIIPRLDTGSDDWVSKIQITLNELLSERPVRSEDEEQRVKALESLLRSEREKSSELESKANQFAATLSETELILSELQNKIESNETNGKVREHEYETELKSRSEENNSLREEIKRLESSLVQIQEFKETIADMEHKLKELQSKLSGEENEKRLLEQKYDEVSKRRQATKNVSNLRQELTEKSKEVEAFGSDKSDIDRIKAESEELKALLEKEKKISKDLNLQNVRLNSLVKIGHESLKMEEDKVRQLEAQLNLNNGSLSSPTVNCSTNGSPETVANNNSNISSDNNSEELFSTFTNPTQTETPFLSNTTNNKPIKAKRRAALAKK